MKRLAKLALPLLLVALFILIPLQATLAAPGWLGSWAYRVKLTVDNTDIDGALADFPILLYISASSGRNSEDITFVFDELTADANRKKIAVTTDDELTQCYVEIEKWDDTNEEAWLWVKAPTIASGTDQDFYLYYDSGQPDNDTYVGDPNDAVAENVWDSDFELVTHQLDDPNTSSTRDSTTNDNDGAKQAANEPQVTTSGQVSDAQNYDGANDFVNYGTDATLDVGQLFTIEAWVKPTALVAYSGVVAKTITARNDTNPPYMLIVHNDGKVGAAYDGNWVFSSAAGISAGNWYRVVWRLTGGTLYYNVNGTAYSSSGFVYTEDASYDTFSGSWYTGNTYDFNGIIDEVRISSVSRNTDWTNACYESERDDLLDWGTEETASPPDAPTNFTITQTGTNDITITWTTGVLATTTVIRAQEDSPPATVADGWEIYNGALETVDDSGLNLGTSIYYYRAWSHNSVGYSTDYAEENIGGETMLLIGILSIAGIMSFLSVRSSFYPLKIAASFCWWGLLAYWMGAEHLTRGSAADTAIILVLIFIGLLFMIWALYTRQGTVDVEDEQTGTGSILKRLQRYTIPRREPTQTGESTLEYRDRVRKALNTGKKRKR